MVCPATHVVPLLAFILYVFHAGQVKFFKKNCVLWGRKNPKLHTYDLKFLVPRKNLTTVLLLA